MNGAFGQNIGKVFSELKLVTDNPPLHLAMQKPTEKPLKELLYSGSRIFTLHPSFSLVCVLGFEVSLIVLKGFVMHACTVKTNLLC